MLLHGHINPSSDRANKLGVKYVSFDDLLRLSDVVSLHVKLTDESYHLIGERELGMMKPTRAVN